MKAYVVCFIFTILFTCLAEKNLKKGYKKKGIINLIIAIFIPTFICGIRMSDVGRDVSIYVTPVFQMAIESSLFVYMNSFVLNIAEPGYLLFTYFVSKIGSNINVLLFFIQLIPCSITFIFAYYYREKIPMWMIIVTYLLTWYLRSYTIMRQSIAIAIIIISIITFEKKKKMTTFLLFLLAFSFHKSVIIAIGIYFVFWIIDTKKMKNKNKIILGMVSLGFMCLLLYNYENLLSILVYNIRILPEKFIYYLNLNELNGTNSFSGSEILFRIIFIVLGFIYLFIDNKEKTTFVKYYIMFLVSMGPYIISFKIPNVERMSYYYYYPALLYIVPKLTDMVKNDKFNKIIISITLSMILFIFWFYKYPISKHCETYPYKTEILNFLN